LLLCRAVIFLFHAGGLIEDLRLLPKNPWCRCCEN
jgi:hypothetical protein